MIAQVIVSIVNQNAEDDAAEELSGVFAGIGALRLQQINQFEVTCTGLSVPPLRPRHRRYECQSSIVTSAIKSFRQERRVCALRHTQGSGWWNVDAGSGGQAMGNEFPGADIAPILPARKLREAEGAVFVPDRRFG